MREPGQATRSIKRASPLRPAVWVMHLSLPLLGLWLLNSEEGADLKWENHDAHFALVVATALVAAAIGVLIATAARSTTTRASSSWRAGFSRAPASSACMR